VLFLEVSKQEQDRLFLEETFLTAEESANYLGITKQAIQSLAKRNILPHIRKGNILLFHRLDIENRHTKQEALRKKYRPYEH
jgi:excisionase family DNA binding protein